MGIKNEDFIQCHACGVMFWKYLSACTNCGEKNRLGE